ncbi:protein SAWADEE HOMEODOMAIN HOMOLOG 1 isoform X1 [Oryza brachyantha]|uniref:protein SAWADEE HOMEODOMAIN HOMOLOG 1 isoform X1 n=1 Tax=Oryza brachyantha TaxID=4533 RepID=UPI0007763EA9|nr:protein SAWADEE HOMEODOMAIN HOMOLOG 1 isoform X1 [Oryza brachyantha]
MERRSSVRFAPSEIARMEKLVKNKNKRVLDDVFCQKLVEEFNCSPGRVGSKALQAAQVQEWFRRKFPASTVKPPCLPTGSEEKALASQSSALVSEEKPPSSEENALAVDTSISNDGEVSPDLPIENIDKLPETEDMEFEARSAKDFACGVSLSTWSGGIPAAGSQRRWSVRFAPSEIARMEKLVKKKNERVLDDVFCQKLVEEFNCSPGRVGSKALQAAQVQEWFRRKFPASTVKPPCLPTGSEEKALASQSSALVSEEKPPSSEENALAVDTSISNDGEVSPDLPIENIDKLPETEDMEFEARSAKDFAWYDVATFLAYRKLSSGEFVSGIICREVRVRFEGFGAEEDEWINVREAIRLQSIPLESSECRLIRQGDLVLCFKESNDDALHFDAHVQEIQRKQHDIRGCRCVFLVKYDHDGTQERVNLRRLSRRPKYA